MASIPEFYAGKNIFLTGATGFVGKVASEKLLRCCPDIKAIYCLIRPKKGESVDERLQKIKQQKLFDIIREQNPDFGDKLHAVNGDIMEDDLGLSDSDKTMLQNTINIVFHSAATVKFDEKMRLSMEMNVLGVRRMISVFKPCKNLMAFVHVSTAYANCDQETIDEMIYPPPVDPQKVIDILDWMSDDMLNMMTPKLIGDKPNTYVFTKHLAEVVYQREAGDMPLAIVRPSIVAATWKEPMPGWVDSYNGPSGLCIATGKGLLRSMIGDPQSVSDMVPVDLPVNTMIAAGWYTATHRPQSDPLVYNVTTGSTNPTTWGEIETLVYHHYKNNPLEACFRRPKYKLMTTSSFLHDCWVLVSHLIPAYAADLGYMLVGKRPRMVKLYNQLHKAIGTMEYFTSREWEWTRTNIEMLTNTMNSEDQKVFYLDGRAIDWPAYMKTYVMGTKKFILKEDLAGLPAARAHLRKLRNIRYVFNTGLLILMWRLLIAKSNLARNSWFFVMGLVFKFVQFFKITSTISTA